MDEAYTPCVYGVLWPRNKSEFIQDVLAPGSSATHTKVIYTHVAHTASFGIPERQWAVKMRWLNGAEPDSSIKTTSILPTKVERVWPKELLMLYNQI